MVEVTLWRWTVLAGEKYGDYCTTVEVLNMSLIGHQGCTLGRRLSGHMREVSGRSADQGFAG